MAGEMTGVGSETAVTGDPGEFNSHPRWQRIAVALAGPFRQLHPRLRPHDRRLHAPQRGLRVPLERRHHRLHLPRQPRRNHRNQIRRHHRPLQQLREPHLGTASSIRLAPQSQPDRPLLLHSTMASASTPHITFTTKRQSETPSHPTRSASSHGYSSSTSRSPPPLPPNTPAAPGRPCSPKIRSSPSTASPSTPSPRFLVTYHAGTRRASPSPSHSSCATARRSRTLYPSRPLSWTTQAMAPNPTAIDFLAPIPPPVKVEQPPPSRRPSQASLGLRISRTPGTLIREVVIRKNVRPSHLGPLALRPHRHRPAQFIEAIEIAQLDAHHRHHGLHQH